MPQENVSYVGTVSLSVRVMPSAFPNMTWMKWNFIIRKRFISIPGLFYIRSNSDAVSVITGRYQ